MLPAPCLVMSDAHLGAAPSERERETVAFLDYARRTAGSVVINGDLFDFWFEWRTVIPRRAFRVLAALGDLKDAGTEVLWIAGNHDCWGGEVLREDIGLDYHVGPWVGEAAGWRTRIEHGDGLRLVEDRKYRALRRVLRHPASIVAFRWLHPDLGSRLATGSSEASRGIHRARDGGAGLRQVAFAALAADPELDLVLFGHSHVRALERAPGGGVYANAGSWLEAPTYLVLTPERVELRRWTGSAEGERLDLLERRPQEALAQP